MGRQRGGWAVTHTKNTRWPVVDAHPKPTVPKLNTTYLADVPPPAVGAVLGAATPVMKGWLRASFTVMRLVGSSVSILSSRSFS